MANKKIKDADLINNPTHYNTGDIECIDWLHKEYLRVTQKD